MSNQDNSFKQDIFDRQMKQNIVSQEKIVGNVNIPVRRLYNKLYGGGGKTAKKKRRVTFDRVTTTPTRVSFKKIFVYYDKRKKIEGEKRMNILKELEKRYNNKHEIDRDFIYRRMMIAKGRLRNLGHFAGRHEIFLESFRHQSSYIDRWLSPASQLQIDATGCTGRLMYNFDDNVYECNTKATLKEHCENGLRFLRDIMFPGILRRFAMSKKDAAVFRTITPTTKKPRRGNETLEEYRFRQYQILLSKSKREQDPDDGMYEVNNKWFGERLDEKTDREVLDVLSRFYVKKYWIDKMNEYHTIITSLY